MKDELLIRYLLDEVDEMESKEVRAWLELSEANKAYFAHFEKIWVVSKSLEPHQDPNVEEAWAKFKNRTSKDSTTKVHRLAYSPWIKVAAVLIACLGIWFVYDIGFRSYNNELVAEQKVISKSLPDGSRITLNKNTSMSYVTDFENHRHVKLETGDAFFEVVPDRSKPFVVTIDDLSVTVVGTSFNVKHRRGKTEVTVETGVVRVGLNGGLEDVHPGETVLVTDGEDEFRKVKSSDNLHAYYRTNKFIAENTPLTRLISVIQEAYDVEIVIAGSSIAKEPINLTLDVNAPLESNLGIICQTLGLKMERNGNRYLLSELSK